MNIYGIGTDIVDNNRIKHLIKKKNFLNRVFSKKEIKFSKNIKNKIFYFSKRFAEKEAFVKSLGIGFRHGINLNEISVLNDNKGKPYFYLNRNIKSVIKHVCKIKKFKCHLSLSDEKKHSLSYVVLERIK